MEASGSICPHPTSAGGSDNQGGQRSSRSFEGAENLGKSIRREVEGRAAAVGTSHPVTLFLNQTWHHIIQILMLLSDIYVLYSTQPSQPSPHFHRYSASLLSLRSYALLVIATANVQGERVLLCSCVDRSARLRRRRTADSGRGAIHGRHQRGQADSNLVDLQISAAGCWLQVGRKGEDVEQYIHIIPHVLWMRSLSECTGNPRMGRHVRIQGAAGMPSTSHEYLLALLSEVLLGCRSTSEIYHSEYMFGMFFVNELHL